VTTEPSDISTEYNALVAQVTAALADAEREHDVEEIERLSAILGRIAGEAL
jgi:hypothetical protein